MTAENQTVELRRNTYQGKKWSIFALIGIFVVVAITFVIRDVGMAYVYSSIYDGLFEEEPKKIGLLQYAITVLLCILPMILPFILRMTKGAYYDEPSRSVIPTFSTKFLTVLMYIVVIGGAVLPFVLFVAGLFTSAYLFVSYHLLLLILSSVTIFYYFGTYFLQRVKASLAVKYIVPTVIMVVVSVISIAASIGAVFALDALGMNVSLIDHMKTFMESWNKLEFTLTAVFMIGFISCAVLLAGLIYNMSQNILYSALPSVVLTGANFALINRIKEARVNLANFDVELQELKERLEMTKNEKAKERIREDIAALEEGLPFENTAVIICYVVMGILAALLLIIFIRTIVGLIRNAIENRKQSV